MGKPIKKKNFGNPNLPTSNGKEITMQANLGDGIVTAWVVEQTGTSEYKLTDGVETLDCVLTETLENVGDAVLNCTNYRGTTETVRVLTQHRMKTFEGSNYEWVDNAVKDGQAQLGESESESEPEPLNALISAVNGISGDSDSDRIQIDWEEGSANELDITLNVTGGSQSFLGIWELSYPSYRNGNYVNIGNSPSSFKTVTKQTIEAAIEKSLSIAEENFIIKGTIRDFDTGETREVFIDVEYIRERISGRLTVALSQVNGLDGVSGNNTNKVGNWIEGQSSSIDTGVFVSGGRPTYTYKWQLSNRDITFVDFNPPKAEAVINITQRDISNTLGIPTVNGEFTLTCTVEDQEEDSNLVSISVLFIGD